jgi:hypothetical protein
MGCVCIELNTALIQRRVHEAMQTEHCCNIPVQLLLLQQGRAAEAGTRNEEEDVDAPDEARLMYCPVADNITIC